jgi:Mg-chelatase subunit ChlD
MSKFSRKSHCLTRVIVTIFAIGILSAVTNAAAENRSDLHLDVVLVMDSSGSMKHTDPRELRKPAAKLLISLLGNHDRASVVSFSDQGYPVAFLTPVKGKSNEAKLFAAVDKISNKGVYTNLLGAVEGAMRVIRRNPLPDRKTIVVLMTDGKMDLGDTVKNQSKSETLINDLIPQLKNQDIELHTIAFTDQSDKAHLQQLAQATGGKFNLAQTDKQLHDVYTSIFEQNKQPNMLPFDGEKFTIDNAIKEVTIVGSKDSEDVVLSLLAPGGEVIAAANKPQNIKWFTAQAFDLITIQKPQPGQWQIKSSTGKNKAYVITNLKFQLEVEPQEVAIGEGFIISAWLEDKGRTIAKPSILSTLNMALRVHTPEGETHELDMQAQSKEDGSGELSGIYMNHVALPADGRFQLEVVAESSTFSRVRNSLVNVFDPNSMPKTNTPTAPETVDEVSPALPDTEPAIDTSMVATTNEADLHTAANEPPRGYPTPEREPPPATEQSVSKHSTSERSVSERSVSEQSIPEHPGLEQQSADPSMGHDTEDNSVTKAAAEHPEQSSHDEPESHKEDPAKEGPNLMKALGIFLVINGVFALFGGIAYLVYRMKKKKSANNNSDNDDAVEEDQEDEKHRKQAA